MKKTIIILQSLVIVILLTLYLVDPWNFNSNIKVNFAIDDLVSYSIEELESGHIDSLKNKLKKIESELPKGGYECHYMESINVLNKNLEDNKS